MGAGAKFVYLRWGRGRCNVRAVSRAVPPLAIMAYILLTFVRRVTTTLVFCTLHTVEYTRDQETKRRKLSPPGRNEMKWINAYGM